MRAPARSLVDFAWSLVDVTNSETLGHEGELIYVTWLKVAAQPRWGAQVAERSCVNQPRVP